MRMPLDAPTNMSRARNTPAERKSRWATCSTNAPRNLRLFVLFALPVRFRKTRHGSRWALAPAPSLRRPVPRSTPTRRDVPPNSSRALPTQEATRSLSEPSSTNVPPLRPPIAPLRSRRIGRRRRLDRGRPLHRHRRPHLLSHVRSGYPGVSRPLQSRDSLRQGRQSRCRRIQGVHVQTQLLCGPLQRRTEVRAGYGTLFRRGLGVVGKLRRHPRSDGGADRRFGGSGMSRGV
mmetsp:Transcript_1792/g.4144  ORF Transcript_1792/g.4144 Transcript_1792/m.4144 type:complete len:233 (-) Transcript_1792:477-1175(-)